MYYDATIRRVIERGYLEKFIQWLPKTDDVKRATDAVMRYVQKRLTP
jgi:hypothetical protein